MVCMAIFIHFFDLDIRVKRMKYKVTNNLLNKILNMRTLSYALGFIFGFLIISYALILMPVKAYMFNFTGSTPQILLSTNRDVDQIKVRYFDDTQSWYLMYNYPSGSNLDNLMSIWNYNFAVKTFDFTTSWFSFSVWGSDSTLIDWIINNNYTLTPNQQFKKVIWVGLVGTNTIKGYSNMSLNQWWSQNGSVVSTSNGFSLTDNLKIFWTDGTDLLYTDVASSGVLSMDGDVTLLLTGTGTLSLPYYVTGITGNNTVKAIYVPSTSEYWIFYPDQDRQLLLSRYDSSFNYINTHTIVSSSVFPDNYFTVNQIYPDYDVMYNERYYDVVYVAMHEYVNNSIVIKAYDTKGTKQINEAVVIDNQYINLTENDPLATGENMTQGISLTTDGNYFYLFYAYNHSSGSEIKVLKEGFTCSCSAWVNESCIDNSHRKQTRTCIPSNCDNIITYVVDSSCLFTPNETFNYTKRYTATPTRCVHFGNDVGTEDSCTFNFSVPIQCQPNSIVVTLYSGIEAEDNKACANGNYNITLCNPSYDCNKYSKPCDQFNWTFEFPAYIYKAGDKGLLQAIGFVPSSCGSCWFSGVDKWVFDAYYKVECDILCYEHWYCIYENYKAYEDGSCNPTNLTYCPNNCNKNTGECYGSAGESLPQPSESKDIFEYSVNLGKSLFSPMVLTVFSVCIIGGSMFTVAYEGKDRIPVEIVLAIGILMSFVFWKIQWLDTIYMILMVLVLALFFANKISSNIKGKGE